MTTFQGGRSRSLDDILKHDPTTGEPITVEQEILRKMATGAYVADCAAGTGLLRTQINDWLRIGNRARKKLIKGTHVLPNYGEPTGKPEITEHEHRLTKFCDAVDQAEDAFALDLEATIARMTHPRTKEIVTVKVDRRGREIERTVRTETLDPDASMVRFRAERHRATRDRYKPPVAEVSGPDGGAIPIETTATTLIEQAKRLKAAKTNPDQEDPDE